MTGPLVSVVIPCYNAARFLPETIESILAQDYPNTEVLLIDDGSTDATSDAVRPYLCTRVQYLRQDNSGGPSRPRNTGIARSTGKYIFFLDSDDIMLPGKLNQSVKLLERTSNVGLLFTNFQRMDDRGNIADATFLDSYDAFKSVLRHSIGDNGYAISRELAYAALIRENFIGTSSVAMPKMVFSEVGMFDENLTNSEDLDLWFRIAKRYDILYLDRVCHYYRVCDTSIERRGALKNAPNRIEVLRRQLTQGLSPDLRREVARWIARNYSSMGYTYQRMGDMRLARRNYIEGLKEHFSWPLVRGVLVTLLGRRLYENLRRIRRPLSTPGT